MPVVLKWCFHIICVTVINTPVVLKQFIQIICVSVTCVLYCNCDMPVKTVYSDYL